MQLKWTDLAAVDLERIEAHVIEDNGPVVSIDVVMNIIDSTHLILPEHPCAGREKHTRIDDRWFTAYRDLSRAYNG